MKPFTSGTSVAAAIPQTDIDTDIIFPARFLVTLDKKGLGKFAFFEWRNTQRESGVPFVLDTPPFDKAEILVAGDKFGVGSSREHAVWALADLGIRCVIAPSFGEIFYSNCFKNGVLPITLPPAAHQHVLRAAELGETIRVNLITNHVLVPGLEAFDIVIPDDRRSALLNGLDEIGTILAEHETAIAGFEKRQRQEAPWLFLKGSASQQG
ncbi:MAG: 3-isopropylmalate dehydratase small subunit [Pseudomonadota bacterium]